MFREANNAYEGIADALFKKHFVIKNNDQISRHLELSTDADDDNEELRLHSLKEKVGAKCDSIGHSTWRSHTTFTHPLKGLPHKLQNDYPSLKPSITQAYCKFVNILRHHPELIKGHYETGEDQFRSLHLCEAPGNFVRALGDFLPDRDFEKWLWRMNSLNPYYEPGDLKSLLFDDSFMIRHMDKMLFGPDNSGNVAAFTEDYIGHIIGETGKFHLVTCDGSFDCRDIPTEQEKILYNLFSQCWRMANKCLAKHGCFVMKIYTFFTDEMHTLITQISHCFSNIYLYKPQCSKPGNSEVYLICTNFRDITPPNINNNEELVQLIRRLQPSLRSGAAFFAKAQGDMINFNLRTYSRLSPHERIAIEIKKNNLVMEVAARSFSHLANAEKRRNKVEQSRDIELNPWLRTVWSGVNVKDRKYDEYKENLFKEESFPRFVTPQPLPSLPSLESLLQFKSKIECLYRHPCVTVYHRPSRSSPEYSHNVISSMFADYRALQDTRDMGMNCYDMCERNENEFRQLKTEFVQEFDGIYVDSPFMTKAAWLELCIIAANGKISPELYPRHTNLVSLIDNNKEMSVDRIHIYMRYGKNLVLSRFSASIIFFLANFFERVAFDKKGIHFLDRKSTSPTMASFVSQLALCLPDCYDLLQFVPSTHFAINLYPDLIDYNNNALLVAMDEMEAKVQSHN